MAGPSRLEERDFLAAVRTQFRDFQSKPEPGVVYDISMSCNMMAAELAGARDAELLHILTQQGTAYVKVGPFSVKCSICPEMTPNVDSFISFKWVHSFCKPSMPRHLVIIATETRQYPLTCPQCQATAAKPPVELVLHHCLAIMAETGAAYDALENLILEKKHMKHIGYCANPTCSMPLRSLGLCVVLVLIQLACSVK